MINRLFQGQGYAIRRRIRNQKIHMRDVDAKAYEDAKEISREEFERRYCCGTLPSNYKIK